MRTDHDRVRALRDRVRELVTAVVDDRPPDPAAVAGLNAAARAAPTTVELHWAPDGTRTRREVEHAHGSSAVLGRIAASAVELLAGATAGELRRCAAPDCWMLFVRTHPRRRWCHPSCGHRDRQARYYRRRLARQGRATS
jgi:predicted RNA-binding Zn ribbon-like protein